MTLSAAARPIQPDKTAKRDPFAAFVTDELTGAALARVAADRGWPEGRVLQGGVGHALLALPRIPTPRLLVIDLSDSADPAADIASLSMVCDAETRVIALGAVNDISLFRKLVALGVDDYLLKPVSAEALAEAIRRAAAPAPAGPADEAAQTGRLVAVVGARGGIGATSIALNLAWLMAHEEGRKTALVDFDLHFGTVALSLDIEPGRGFADALQSPDRIDGLFMERTLVRAGKNLSVLAAEWALDAAVALDGTSVEPLIARLNGDFDYVIADVPRAALLAAPVLIDAADVAVVVSDLTLAGMRDALRLLDFVKARKPDIDVRLVVNRTGQMKKGEMRPDEFELQVDARIAARLPFEPAAAAKSARLGRPWAAIARRSRFTVGLRHLAGDVAAPQDAAKASLWHRLTGRRS